MKSLKSKLILAISLFILVLLTVGAFLQVREQSRNFTNDIFINSRSYAELTADQIVNDYKLFLIPKSFVYFNREINELFAKNEDIDWIQILNYEGEVLYDSREEQEAQYKGSPRTVEDQALLEAVKSQNLSVRLSGLNEFAYFKKNEAAQYLTVDFEENPIQELKLDQRIDYVVNPVANELAVVYGVTYEALQARIAATQFRILLLAVFGVGIGVLLAIFFGSTITKPLQILKKGVDILATGNLSHRVHVKTKDEIHLLAESFNKMAADLQESTKALVYKERVGKELELAKQIQSQIIPKTIPLMKGIDICAGLIPAEEIGGDCYDFLPIDENNLMFYLGDVTGHGVPSGIVVSIANALFYTYVGQKPMDEILAIVNEVIKMKTTASMFLTLVLLKWDALSNKMHYVSAGHEQIIHYIAAEDRVVLLPAGGLALGMVRDIANTLTVREINYQPGDVLVLYSDGIPEAWKSEKEMYGMERFMQIVKQYSKFDTSLAIRNALLADVHTFRSGFKQMDDITTIVIKRK